MMVTLEQVAEERRLSEAPMWVDRLGYLYCTECWPTFNRGGPGFPVLSGPHIDEPCDSCGGCAR